MEFAHPLTSPSSDRSNGSVRRMVVELENSLPRSGRDEDRVQVLGHRGSPAAPGRAENSVAAVTEALRRGADGVEIDVRLTADGTLVCAHNPQVVGRTGAVLDVAANSSDVLRGQVDSLATLPELLAAAQRPAGTRVVVEAKPVPDPAVARRTALVLAEVLRSATGTARVTVSSFDPVLLSLIRQACADLPVRTALLGSEAAPAEVVVGRAHEDGHDEVHLPVAGVRRTPETVQTAHRLGLTVACWTVNRRRDLRWVAALGVAAVITDDVPRARRELDRAAVLEQAAA